MGFDLLSFHKELAQQGIIFCFRGPVSQFVIEGIGQTLRQKMELEDAGMTTIQKVFSIFVEQMQNVVSYSAERIMREDLLDGDMRVGVLVVGRENKSFFVLCGNSIRKDQLGRIRNELDRLRAMDREQLKALYRERRKMKTSSGGKGACLGFIDMARKASMPIEYGFAPMDDRHTFFSIKAVI